jgi:FSR family fosmidomycin resistance protein-like MFS transporter
VSASSSSLEQPAAAARLPVAALGALVLGHAAVDLCTGIWPVFKTLAGLDLARAGLIATVASMIGNGLQPMFGLIADHGRGRRLLVGGMLLASAVTFLPLALPFGELVLFALVMTTYLGSSAFHPSGTGAAGALGGERKGLVVGLFLTGGYVGYAASQGLFSTLWAAPGRPTWLIGVVPLIAAGILLRAPIDRPRRHGSLRDVFAAFHAHRRTFLALFTIQVFTTAAQVALIFLMPELMLAHGQPAWMAHGGAHAALVLGSALSLVPGGLLADRLGARRVLVACNLACIALGAAVLLVTPPAPVQLLLLTLFGAAIGVNNVVAVAEGNRLLPGQAGTASAVLMGLPWVFAATASAIAGALADPAHGGSVFSALAWMGLSLPLALIAAASLRPAKT